MPPAMAATSTPDATAADGAPSLTPQTGTPGLAGSDSTPPAAPPVDSSGFYRLQGERLQFAPNAVHAPGHSLSRDNREAAHSHHGLLLPQPATPDPVEPQAQGQTQGQPAGPRRRHPGAGPRGASAARPAPGQSITSRGRAEAIGGECSTP
jgi:hypothetical protein